MNDLLGPMDRNHSGASNRTCDNEPRSARDCVLLSTGKSVFVSTYDVDRLVDVSSVTAHKLLRAAELLAALLTCRAGALASR